MGPSRYGELSFLLGSFTAFAALTDLGASNAFFTFMSQGPKSRRFVLAYACWLVAQVSLLALFVIAAPEELRRRVWLGHGTGIILLALLAYFASVSLWNFLGQVGDSARDTAGVQTMNLLQGILFLLLLIGVVERRGAGVKLMLELNITAYLAMVPIYLWRLAKKVPCAPATAESARATFARYVSYAYPSLTIIGFAYAFFDPWFLYKVGGAAQQGFYSVAVKISALSILAAEAVSPVYWKEIAEAAALGDAMKMRRLFGIFARGLYFLAAFVSCFAIPFSKEILALSVGPAYAAGWAAFAVMMLYPLPVAENHVYEVTLLSTERTALRTRLQLVTMILSVIATYFMLAPRNATVPGLGLGALGLALKMFLCQFLHSRLSEFFCARQLSARQDWLHRLALPVLLLGLGLSAKAVSALVVPGASPLFRLAAAGVLYTAAISLLAYTFPPLVGLTREQVNARLHAALGHLR